MKSDHSNPLAVTLPYQFNSQDEYPTEMLARRFQVWRYIIKDLVSYLKEYASVQEEIVRQQIRLQQAVGISANSIAVNSNSSGGHHHNPHQSSSNNNKEVDVGEINRYFLPIGNGSIQDLPTILTKYHQQNVSNTQKTLKELNNVIIPKLEELRKDLLIKIKEIKNLQNDFKNNLGKEINETKNLLNQYYQAIDLSNKLEHGAHSHHSSDSNDQYKYDPYIVKVKLERQLKKQLQEENYLYQAYENLQESGRKLESIIVVELQNYLGNFINSLAQEHSSFTNFLLPNFNNGFLSKERTFEWDSFIAKNLPSASISLNAVGTSNSSVKNGTFIDLNFPSRKFSDLIINNYNTSLNLPVREGYLERRSKFLKNYSRGWYVLTCNFIHEFKTPDRKKDQVPILSILLDSCQVSDHSKNDGKADGTYKFILNSKLTNGLMHRNQNWVFRTDTYQSMIDWYNGIKNLTSLPTPAARARFLNKKLNLGNVNPNLVSVQSKASRASSLVSNGTFARSIHTNDTGSKKSATTTENKRLSSTFSQRSKVQSPKLNHLINSDGTILTPVESKERNIENSTPLTMVYSQGQQPPEGYYQIQPVHSDKAPDSSQNHSVQYQIPTTTIQQPTPQQPSQPPGPIVLPPNFVNFQQGYHINSNGQQVQQFYDPIQQQYYTITQQPSQGPQPQYFPTSPQPQFPTSPQPNQGYFYAQPLGPQAQQPQNQNQHMPTLKGDYNFGGQLPYPAHNDQVIHSRESLATKEIDKDLTQEENATEETLKQDAGGKIEEGAEKVTKDTENTDNAEVENGISQLSI